MRTVRRSQHRGRTQTDWLDSRHTFSFGDYSDAVFERFGALRVINEDVIKGGAGFSPHPHKDMEIVTYILAGALAHRDSLGTGSVIRAGQIQRMSAGSGIVHAEFNASREEAVHLLQIWIVPSRLGLKPSYEQKKIDRSAANRLVRIAAPDPIASEVRLAQDAEIWSARFEGQEEVIHPLAQGRRAWVQVARGSVEIGGETLAAGDGMAVNDEDAIVIRARGPAEALLFDLA